MFVKLLIIQNTYNYLVVLNLAEMFGLEIFQQ